MDLINFEGLNCYYNCIVSVANCIGVDYCTSFATLWSETEFKYDKNRKVYLTKRMLTNLDTLGAKFEMLECFSVKQRENSLSMFQKGEFIIIGMDVFYIPWNELYGIHHGPHYFIARNSLTEYLICFDPTYKQKGQLINFKEVVSHAFDISRMYKVTEDPLQCEIKFHPISEACEVLRTHSNIRHNLVEKVSNCSYGDQKNTIQLAKYVDTMISNRYLYKYYLQRKLFLYDKNNLFFNREFFLKWKAVKNGLYKAAIIKNNKEVIDEVCSYLSDLIDEETSMAEKMISSIYVN